MRSLNVLKRTSKKYLTREQFFFLRYIVYSFGVVKELIKPTAKARCTICNYAGRFRPYGYPPRYGAECPACGSFERHRLLKLWCDREGNAFLAKARTLHFAPEDSVRDFVTPIAGSYQTADITLHRADLRLDIEALTPLADESYDAIICLHVLEHVDDAKALAELRRVLAKDGVLVAMVPLIEGWASTYENPGIKDPQGRLAHFGQSDHVRFYGADFRKRLADAGFTVNEFTATEPDVVTFGLLRGEKVFLCRKCNRETTTA
jgi:SAM-dependent methyltransferase